MDELAYEPALDEGRRDGEQGQQAREAGTAYGDVMSSVTAAGDGPVRNGFAVSPRSGSVIPATPEAAARARAGKAAARERYRLAAEQGLLNAAQAVAVGVYTPEQGWQKIVEAQTELALAPDARGSTQAAALVGKAIGATERDRDEGGGGNSVVINLSDAAVAQIALALAGKLDNDE